MVESGLIVTGATGFFGRHVLEGFAGTRKIWALSRSSPTLRGTSIPSGVDWLPADISDTRAACDAVESVSKEGPIDTIIHLAGHYDFTGEEHEYYATTNVLGTRNVLEAARLFGVKDFVFASSVAACQFPEPGKSITEASPPDGDTPYARSKAEGERLLSEYRGEFRAWTVRFAALFSDWCEYEPLFRFLESWLSGAPAGRIVAGKGLSAVPYLHVHDAVLFLRCLLDRREHLDDETVLVASPRGATTHLELFEAATGAHFGGRSRPLRLAALLCRSGLRAREIVGNVVGMHAFERPWMGRMIDKQLRVNPSETTARTGWSPRPRLEILRRMPFLIENRKAFPAEWLRRNREALRETRRGGDPEIRARISKRKAEFSESLVDYVTDPHRADRFPRLRTFARDELSADADLLIDALLMAVGTGDKPSFAMHCRTLALRRNREGLRHEEWASALDVLNDICVLSLLGDDSKPAWSQSVYDHVTMTVQFGIDAILEAFEED